MTGVTLTDGPGRPGKPLSPRCPGRPTIPRVPDRPGGPGGPSGPCEKERGVIQRERKGGEQKKARVKRRSMKETQVGDN